jgi:polar amino acid transport system substrate-binding protein
MVPNPCGYRDRRMENTMRGTKRLALALVAALATIGIAAGCGGGGSSNKYGLITDGTLTVGSDIPYPPTEFGRAPDYKGIDIELVDAIATKLGLQVSWQDTSFTTIFRDLAQGKFDMVASATTITPERQKEVDFSNPYFLADQSLMVKKGSGITNASQIAGKVVGAQKGTTGAAYAEDHTDASSVRTYPEIDDAFNALEAGQITAVINDCPISKYAEKSKPDLQVVEALPTGEKYGFAFQKGNTALEDAVNNGLAEVKKDGTYTKIFDKYLGNQPCRKLPGASG